MGKAWKLCNGWTLAVQETDEGVDYSLYDEDYVIVDGGRIDNPDLSLDVAGAQISRANGYSLAAAFEVSYEEVDERAALVN